jgi:two-component system CheB/CheR fusion protein
VTAVDDLLIVGVGASAGGVKALRQFFEKVPVDGGISYVAILHLSPEHDSHLAEVLQVSCPLPVTQVREHVRVEPNHVYVISPNQSLSLTDGALSVSKMVRLEERRAPVDIFFRTLADARGSHSVCVLLSGTGSDGSMGLKRIKERGGMCLVQDPAEAEHGDMPRNAMATGLVDHVLSVGEIPAKISAYKRTLGNVRVTEDPTERVETEERAIRDVFAQLRARTGHDFANYKRSTMWRRLERRLAVHELPDLPAYAEYLRENPDEAQSLLKDLLISVTNFFRDREPVEILKRTVIPKLLANKTEEHQVRAWVVGCATGEEAYSLAMLLAEHASNVPGRPSVQVFATDIDDGAIQTAREALYSASDTADVSPERLRRFFTKEGDSYRVRKELREMVLFARHNVIKDPPFSHLDFVSCRNLLIYLNRGAQERVLNLLHFGLRSGGYLFLGTSESIDGSSNLFVPVEKDANIFQSRELPLRPMIALSEPASFVTRPQTTAPIALDERAVNRARERTSYADLHQRLLEEYAPPSVVVNEEYDILHLSDRAAQYLQFVGGEPSTNLLQAIRPELRLDLRTALYQASQIRTRVEAKNLKLQLARGPVIVDIVVRPVLREGDTARGFFLVVFKSRESDPDLQEPETTVTAGEAARHLEDEVVRVRAQQRATVEQYEIQTEELKASNEELQAMNEELRSTAEELETSKEELQSVNEELTTVNQELKIKIEEQSQATNDIQNLVNTTEIAAIFLDRSSRIKLYTPRACDVFNLIPTDSGRPLSDISSPLKDDGLQNDITRVLERLERVEREVETRDGRWHLMNIVPYRTSDDRIDGVVLTFIDVTERKRSEARIAESERRFRAIVSQTTAGVAYADLSGKLLFANKRVAEMFGWQPNDLGSRTLEEITRTDDAAEDSARFERLTREGTPFTVERPIVPLQGAPAWVSVYVSPIRDATNTVESIVAVVLDISQRRRAEEDLRNSEERLRHVLEGITEYALITLDAKGIIEGWNLGAEQMFGYTADEAIGEPSEMIFTPEDRAGGVPQQELRTAREEGRSSDERWQLRKDGSRFFVSGVLSPLGMRGQSGFVKVARDLTERKQYEESLQSAHDELEARVVDRTRQLAALNAALEKELGERREAEERVRKLLSRLITVQEDERRRIARDLHDDLGQKMTALHLKLESLRRRHTDGTELHAQVQDAQSFVRKLDRDLDFFTWELRPAALYDLGLAPALRDYVTQWSNNYNIHAEFDTIGIGAERLRSDVEINMYRIAQEALNNVYKHAQATKTNVVLQRRDNSLVLSVEDNGVGFDTVDVDEHGRGIGLIGMRERAALMNGSVEIERAASGGTTVLISAPWMLRADGAEPPTEPRRPAGNRKRK